MVKKKQKPVHPGEVLRLELEDRGITQLELARDTGYTPAYISNVVNRKRGVSPKMAIRFEKVLGGAAKFWTDLQTNYDLEIAREEEKGR